jgi:hypothetical protein
MIGPHGGIDLLLLIILSLPSICLTLGRYKERLRNLIKYILRFSVELEPIFILGFALAAAAVNILIDLDNFEIAEADI